MSRLHVDGLTTPSPMGRSLPGLYRELQDDELRVARPGDTPMVQRFTEALDEILAPIFATLDSFDAYIDPALAPDDFLDWLAGWVGVLLDETWPIERRRAFVAMAAELYRQRGTAAGLANHVRVFTNGDVDVEESGAAAWATTPDAAMPGSPGFTVLVKVKPAAREKVDVTRLDALVAAAKPAHVVHRVEVVGSTG